MQATILASIIRTVVPVVVGQIISWLALLNVQATADDKATLTSIVGGLITIVYYIAVRLLEQKFPQIGILLGKAAQPVGYAKLPPVGSQSATPPVISDGPDHRA